MYNGAQADIVLVPEDDTTDLTSMEKWKFQSFRDCGPNATMTRPFPPQTDG
jgi:hypothetical protein